MKIVRTINGKEVEIELTQEEKDDITYAKVVKDIAAYMKDENMPPLKRKKMIKIAKHIITDLDYNYSDIYWEAIADRVEMETE